MGKNFFHPWLSDFPVIGTFYVAIATRCANAALSAVFIGNLLPGKEMGRWGDKGTRGWGDNQQIPITKYQLPITNYPLPITHYQLPITNYPLPMPNKL